MRLSTLTEDTENQIRIFNERGFALIRHQERLAALRKTYLVTQDPRELVYFSAYRIAGTSMKDEYISIEAQESLFPGKTIRNLADGATYISDGKQAILITEHKDPTKPINARHVVNLELCDVQPDNTLSKAFITLDGFAEYEQAPVFTSRQDAPVEAVDFALRRMAEILQ